MRTSVVVLIVYFMCCLVLRQHEDRTPYSLFCIASSFLPQAHLPNLRDVLFVGNPIYDDMPKEQARIEVLRRLPQVAKIDGDMVKPTERELATGVAAV